VDGQAGKQTGGQTEGWKRWRELLASISAGACLLVVLELAQSCPLSLLDAINRRQDCSALLSPALPTNCRDPKHALFETMRAQNIGSECGHARGWRTQAGGGVGRCLLPAGKWRLTQAGRQGTVGGTARSSRRANVSCCHRCSSAMHTRPQPAPRRLPLYPAATSPHHALPCLQVLDGTRELVTLYSLCGLGHLTQHPSPPTPLPALPSNPWPADTYGCYHPQRDVLAVPQDTRHLKWAQRSNAMSLKEILATKKRRGMEGWGGGGGPGGGG